MGEHQDIKVAVVCRKYAVVLKVFKLALSGKHFMANTDRPYHVPPGMENHAHSVLEGTSRFVIVADKQTLLNNPFDLGEDDFNHPLTLPDAKPESEPDHEPT